MDFTEMTGVSGQRVRSGMRQEPIADCQDPGSTGDPRQDVCTMSWGGSPSRVPSMFLANRADRPDGVVVLPTRDPIGSRKSHATLYLWEF